MELFTADGYAGTPITAIERRVGLAAGTGSFQRHFRTKRELLHAAVEYEVERCIAEIEAASEAAKIADDGDSALRDRYEQILQDIRRFDRLFRLMLNEGQHVPELRATMARALDATASGAEWDQSLTVVVAVAALGGYHFLGLMQGRDFQGVSPSEFIAELTRMTGLLD
jgi:AcrR family transcriptional regulator